MWGNSPKSLLAHLDSTTVPRGFDLVLLSDLVFNHSEHAKLIKSIQDTLRRTPEARALAFFTPHRTWLLQEDMKFFELASRSGFEVRKVYQKAGDQVMFKEDKGVSRLRTQQFLNATDARNRMRFYVGRFLDLS